MLYPPNMAALPDVPYSYPHFSSNPHLKSARVLQPRESPSPHRQSTYPKTCSAHSSDRRDSQPKKPKSNLWDYVTASLGDIGLIYCNYAIPTPIHGAEWGVPWSPVAHPRPPAAHRWPPATHAVTRVSRLTPEPPATRFRELLGEVEKAKGRKRQKIKKCGRRFGNWVANLCPQGRRKQDEEENLTPPLSGGQEGSVPKRESKVLGRRVSASSDMTLVETLEKHARAHPPTSPRRSSRRRNIYTGH